LIHPHTQLRFINQAIGFGVFATRFIPRGTLTWVCDELDQIVDAGRVLALPPFYRRLLDTYTFRDRHGRHVLCWDLARFMNHSCAPCCLGPDSSFEIAVRDIQAGEELTDDYASLQLQAHESFRCHCSIPGCRQWISSADFAHCSPAWDRLIDEVMKLPAHVPQPLAPILQDAVRRQRLSSSALKMLQPLVEQIRRHSSSVTPPAIPESSGICEVVQK
jgi:hypothetical protein